MRKNFKRKTFKRRAPRRGRKFVKKTFRKAGNFVKQRFTTKQGTIIIPTTTSSFYDFQPSISNIIPAELAAYQELYDEYRIVGIKVSFVPQITSAQVDSFGGNIPNHYVVTDKNDANSLPTVAAALAYNNCQRKKMTQPLSRYCRPSPTLLLEDTNGNKFVQEQPPKWIQLDNSIQPNNINVEHLGVKYITEINNSGETLNVDVFETLWVEFKTKL